jgi:hypothetical protein
VAVTSTFILYVFVHLQIFEDGFTTSKVTRDKGHIAIYVSAGEFANEHRWGGSDCPTVVLSVIYNKKFAKTVPEDYLFSCANYQVASDWDPRCGYWEHACVYGRRWCIWRSARAM